MTQLEFITNVKIDHEFYRLTLLDYTGDQFTYQGKFKEVPNYINEIINSEITISASKKISGDEGIHESIAAEAKRHESEQRIKEREQFNLRPSQRKFN